MKCEKSNEQREIKFLLCAMVLNAKMLRLRILNLKNYENKSKNLASMGRCGSHKRMREEEGAEGAERDFLEYCMLTFQ